MAFNPVGGLDPANAVLLPEALAAARSLRAHLPSVSAGGITRLYDHWTAGHLDQSDGQYNLMVDLNDATGSWQLLVTHDPRANLVQNANEAFHTQNRNTGALGVCLAGMFGASPSNFAADALQVHELHFLCALNAVAAAAYNIDLSARFAQHVHHAADDGSQIDRFGEFNLLTHGEVAVIDLYPRDRWDLGTLVPIPAAVEQQLVAEQGHGMPSPAMRSACGDALRLLSHRYKIAL